MNTFTYTVEIRELKLEYTTIKGISLNKGLFFSCFSPFLLPLSAPSISPFSLTLLFFYFLVGVKHRKLLLYFFVYLFPPLSLCVCVWFVYAKKHVW